MRAEQAAEPDPGELEPDLLADLVVLSGNPLTTPTSGLSEIHVSATVIDGQIEWKEDVDPAG